MNNDIIEIIQDHTSMEIALRMILEALETKTVPPQGIIPTFNDSLIEENVFACFKLIAKKDC